VSKKPGATAYYVGVDSKTVTEEALEATLLPRLE
jgi:hypothetical protein